MSQFTETQLRDYAEKLIAQRGEDGAREFVSTAGYDKETTEKLINMISGKSNSNVASAMAENGELDDFGVDS